MRHPDAAHINGECGAGPVSDVVTERAVSTVPVVARLSFVERPLPVWILAAMGLGIGLGRDPPSMSMTRRSRDHAKLG